jgi:hypothetical protein
MKRSEGNRIKTLNIGLMVRRVMKQKHKNKMDIAKVLTRNHGTISRIVKGRSMQAYLVWELSLALKHNFFNDLAEQLNSEAGEGTLANAGLPLKATIAALEKEVQQLKDEREYLRKVVDVLGKRG